MCIRDRSYTEQIAILVLAHPLPWQNDANATDANADGSVSPVDALVIINYINEHGSGSLPVPPPTTIVFYFDTNGDGFASPVDVLLVVNLLNAQPASEGENPLPSIIAPTTPYLNMPKLAVRSMQRQLDHDRNSPSFDAYFNALRYHPLRDQPSNDASQRTATQVYTDLDELIDELFEPRSTTETEDIFADWPRV